MKENTLYYTEDYVQGKLSDNLHAEKISQKEVNTERLKDILENNISKIGHLCISVYRHTFKHNEDIYNVCLSCGDFYKNDNRFYLSKDGVEKFKEDIK